MPDPCLDSSDPGIALSAPGGNLKASLIVRPGSCTPPDPAAGKPNGLKVTTTGVWAPPQTIHAAGEAFGFTNGLDVNFGSGAETEWPGSTITCAIQNPSTCLTAHATIIVHANGPVNVVPDTEIDVSMRTFVNDVAVGLNAYTNPYRWKSSQSGDANTDLMWTTLDTITYPGIDPGETITFKVIHYYQKIGAAGGHLGGFSTRISWILGTDA